MTKEIIHISHTNINWDYRILKELEAVSLVEDANITAIGVEFTEGQVEIDIDRDNINIETITLLTKKLQKTRLPGFIRQPLVFIELALKMTYGVVRKKPHIVHCHDAIALPIGWICSILTGSKLIYDAHELMSDKQGNDFISRFYIKIVEKVCWSKVETLISVSDSIISWYRDKYGKKRFLTILNSPPRELYEETAEGVAQDHNYLRKKFDIPENHIIFLFVGQFMGGRSIELFLKIFEQELHNSHLILLGFGEGEILETIQETSSRCSNIHLHDAVAHNEVISIAKNADYGLCFIQNVSLSDWYSLPNKLFEYLLSGLPVLASNCPEIMKMIKQYHAGECLEPNEENLVKKIRELELKKPLRVDTDRSEITWEFQAKKLQEEYKILLSRPN